MNSHPLSVKAVFDEAVEIDCPGERKRFLDRVCADAPDLRQEVEGLLLAYKDAGTFLESPPLSVLATPPPPAPRLGAIIDEQLPGAVIGPYKLLEQIGEGGFG